MAKVQDGAALSLNGRVSDDYSNVGPDRVKCTGELLELADRAARDAFGVSLEVFSDRSDEAGEPLTPAFVKSLVAVELMSERAATQRASLDASSAPDSAPA